MVEINKRENILSYIGKVDAIIITTNGSIKYDGRLVMGAGVAGSLNKAYPNSDKSFGNSIKKHGHICHVVGIVNNTAIVSFPTKPETGIPRSSNEVLDKYVDHIGKSTQGWMYRSDPELIRKSARELMLLQEKYSWKQVIMVKPGCSNGGLSWNNIKPMIKFLNNHFYVLP